MHAQIDAVTKNVPEDDATVLFWLLEQSQSDLIELLAVLTCVSVYSLQSHSHGAKPRPLDRMGDVAGLGMIKWWKPTAQSHLVHVSQDRIVAVVTGAVDLVRCNFISRISTAASALDEVGLRPQTKGGALRCGLGATCRHTDAHSQRDRCTYW